MLEASNTYPAVLFCASTAAMKWVQEGAGESGKGHGNNDESASPQLHPCLKKPCSKADWVASELQRTNKQTEMCFQAVHI